MSKLKNVKTLTTTAMLIAIGIVLGFFKIPVTNLIEIHFSQLPLATIGVLFGPGIGTLSGILMDLGQYLVKPTGPFFPGFTLSSAITGFIFAAFLYKKEATLVRIILAQIVYTLVVGIVLNSIWLSMLYGNAFFALVTARVAKEIVMTPINTILLSLIIKPVVHLNQTTKQSMDIK